MVKRSSIGNLPKEVRAWLDSALIEGNFSRYEALEVALQEKGYQISKSAIHRYGQPLQRRLAAIKASTEAARMLTEGAADDQDARSEAVIALIQTEMFDSILALQEAAETMGDPIKRMDAMSKVAKNIATLTRASVGLKKFQTEVREKLEAKFKALEAEANAGEGKKGRMDLDTLRRVREEIYGIVSV